MAKELLKGNVAIAEAAVRAGMAMSADERAAAGVERRCARSEIVRWRASPAPAWRKPEPRAGARPAWEAPSTGPGSSGTGSRVRSTVRHIRFLARNGCR